MFDCDDAALPDRDAGTARQGRLIEDACAAGIELAIMSGTDIADLDGRLPARRPPVVSCCCHVAVRGLRGR